MLSLSSSGANAPGQVAKDREQFLFSICRFCAKRLLVDSGRAQLARHDAGVRSQQLLAFVYMYGNSSSAVSEVTGAVRLFQCGSVPTQSRPEGFVFEVKAHSY